MEVIDMFRIISKVKRLIIGMLSMALAFMAGFMTCATGIAVWACKISNETEENR